jgi:glycosyl transferase, family 25
MRILDYFDRIIVINLPNRPDRKKFITRELENFNIPTSSRKVKIFSAIRPHSLEGFPSIGAYGCFLSHYTALKQARDDGMRRVLIMEDDLKISEHFREQESEILSELQKIDWAFVYLGHVIPTIELDQKPLQIYKKPILCSHFVGVNHSILDLLILFLEQVMQRPEGHPDGGPMHVDGAYSTFRQQNPNIVTLVANPSMGKQRSSRSDIAPNRWFDEVPLLKKLISLVRQLKI